MLVFLIKLLLFAAICSWLWSVSGFIRMKHYQFRHRADAPAQNWESYVDMFNNSRNPVHKEFRRAILGMVSFLICVLLLMIVHLFHPAIVEL